MFVPSQDGLPLLDIPVVVGDDGVGVDLNEELVADQVLDFDQRTSWQVFLREDSLRTSWTVSMLSSSISSRLM